MDRRLRHRLVTLAALAAALGVGAASPSLAEGGGHGGGGDHGVPGIGAGVGGGASPGGVIGGGLAGGVGGPGGLGGSPRNGGAGGGGGGSISPLSPNVGAGSHPGGGEHGLHNPLSPGDSAKGAATLRHAVSDLPEADDALRHAHGRGRDQDKGGDRKDSDKLARALTDADAAVDDDVKALTQSRRQQARALLEFHRDAVEPDDAGRPVVRGEILALAPRSAALARAQQAGFRVRSSESLPGIGMRSVVLMGPRGVSAVEALRRIRSLDPQGQYDFNHLYQESGAVGARRTAAGSRARASTPAAHGVKVGLVDGGVAAAQPALGGARIVQRGFARGGPHPSAHATAVASLLAGSEGRFRGAAPGATVYVADVFGSTPTGGSAEAIARALGWLAQEGAPVINVSLVGPPNLLLEAAVKALTARGHLIVAAVGNDGPAAPPLYPASYPGVVAVTGVDPRRHVLPEAGHATHVDFAAPGSEMAAAGLDGGFVAVRGTSFAAPLAAGLLARQLTAPGREAASRALDSLGRKALDLGAQGPDQVYGRGLVALELRTAPAEVQAHLALRDQ